MGTFHDNVRLVQSGVSCLSVPRAPENDAVATAFTQTHTRTHPVSSFSLSQTALRCPLTCESQEAADALRQRQALEVSRQLHFDDAGQAIQHHGAGRGLGQAGRDWTPLGYLRLARRTFMPGSDFALLSSHRSSGSPGHGACAPPGEGPAEEGGRRGSMGRRPPAAFPGGRAGV